MATSYYHTVGLPSQPVEAVQQFTYIFILRNCRYASISQVAYLHETSDQSVLTFQNFFLLSPCPVLCSASDHWRLMVSHCERIIYVYSTFSYNIVQALCGVLYITGVPTVVPVLRYAGVTKGASLVLFPFRSVRNKHIRTYTRFI